MSEPVTFKDDESTWPTSRATRAFGQSLRNEDSSDARETRGRLTDRCRLVEGYRQAFHSKDEVMALFFKSHFT